MDFIVERQSELFAIEVKSSKRISAADLRGLKSFREFHGKKHRSLLIYLGEQEMRMDEVEILPLTKAMKTLGYA